MTRDSFDMFAPKERGRFGENELDRREPAFTGQSTVTDVDVFLRVDAKNAIAVCKSNVSLEPYIWLPKSQIEYTGKPGEKVVVTLPRWLAREKDLSDLAHNKRHSEQGGSSA